MNICPDCFSASGLKRRLQEERRSFPNGVSCDFHPTKKGIPVKVVAGIVDPVFTENFVGGPYDAHYDRYLETVGSDLEDTLLDLTGADDTRVIDGLIAELIDADSYWPPDGEEAFYDHEYRYSREQTGLSEHNQLWSAFKTSLMHQRRFFNAEAEELLKRIFEDVHQQRDLNSSGPVYMIAPGGQGSSFVRARVANEPAKLEDIKADLARKLGPPPERMRKPGRLNPSGISAFYGAYDADTCIAELRPSVGELVALAEFRITEAICVLDTTLFGARPKAYDPFAAKARKRAAQWLFMTGFMNEIARPILPDDVHLDYVPTQAVAEFLSNREFEFARGKRTIDAIIYGSAQHPGGRNIALLGPASVVGSVAEPPNSKPTSDESHIWSDWLTPEPRARPRIVPIPESFRVHRVGGVTFTAPALEPIFNEEGDAD
ncbi:RES domain protein [Agrobacterium rosae]|uniref:RES domain protein n=1 Tax=Agrobacterium rosae TaxID=1972867 RepID=A0A1R3TY50_9HYPH|nr:RES domain protein [Agrobacterium rosae]